MQLLPWEIRMQESRDLVYLSRVDAQCKEDRAKAQAEAERKAKAKHMKALAKQVSSLQQAIDYYIAAYKQAMHVDKDEALAQGYRSRAMELRRGELYEKELLLTSIQEQ